MVMDSQFALSLSLELSKLLPLTLSGAAKTYEAAMKLARDLQSSRSDIVIEEDLAKIFGRATITPELTRSFKTVVARPADPKPLAGTICLITGAGPTVIRALTETPYFSTVVQCSFLTNVFENASLAAALCRYFEKREQDAPQEWSERASPSHEGIQGTLQPCRDQTSSFDWEGMLLAVAATLGLDDEAIHEPLPTNILEGLIPTLPLVQHLPEEHFIHVQAGYGTWAIVVWAHHILGLNVLVKSSRHSNSIIQRSDAKSTGIISETCFGSSHPRNVIVDLGSRRLQPEITLQSNTGNGPTFHLKPEPEMENIIANQKRHLQGYGKRILNKTISYHLARERVIDELSLVACAFAVCASRKLCAGGIVRGASDHWIALETASEESFTPSYRATAESPKPAQDLLECDLLEIPTPRIIEATRVLFDDHHRIKPETIKDYILLYSSRPLATIPEPPESIAVHIRSWKRDDMWNQNPTSWGKMSSAACGLCVVLLALANVVDIDKAAQLPIREYIHEVRRSTLHQLLLEWDGTSLIPVNERVWFEIISLLMLGQSAAEDEACCLVSDFGWSLYVHTVREEDPSHVLGGNPVVQPGVPWRNSIWKHSVRDGPLGSPSDHSVWRKTAEFGQEAGTVSRACNVERGKTFVGEQRDSFVVSVHLHTTDSGTSGHTVTLRTGYGELSSALLGARTTESCAHKTTRRDKVKLPPGWSMLEGFGGHDNPKSLTRYKLCPTAANSLARWRALLSILENDDRDERQRTMLRKPDCCLRCAIDQTSSMDGAWFLVL